MEINPTCKYIKFMKFIEILYGNHRKSSFIPYYRQYLEHYEKKDKRVVKQALDRYMEYTLVNNPKSLSANPQKEDIIGYIDYLTSHSKGSGAASTYARFRKVMRAAVKDRVLSQDPCNDIRLPNNRTALIKDILSESEIIKLISTPLLEKMSEVKRAFIFSLYTGMRFCDIKALTYKNIDYSNRIITFEQCKTKHKSSKSVVHIPLRKDLISIIEPAKGGDEHIFNLPSHPTCMKVLKQWTTAAGIEKHITWHCARHTFATNILQNGADIRVVADLLGHSSLKYVEIYTRVIDSRKTAAINSLPPIL